VIITIEDPYIRDTVI